MKRALLNLYKGGGCCFVSNDAMKAFVDQMKSFSSVLLVTSLIGCGFKSDKLIDYSNLIASNGQLLCDNGFLDFADSIDQDHLRKNLIASFDIYSTENFKIVHIDAEELVEYNFNFFIPRLSQLLERRGFELDVRVASDYENTNDIYINGTKVNLYTKRDLENGSFWDSGPRKFFKEINTQLASRNVSELFYLLYDGNDLHTILLTPAQHSIIESNYKYNQREIPYLP
ncbi:MAG: hypothetical protein KF775_08320 [Cyclobacteriaceae bacterium]|nr:hypothetical protein [Cyclobacteriaceae bacterium]